MRSTQHTAWHWKTCNENYLPFFHIHLLPAFIDINAVKKKVIQKISFEPPTHQRSWEEMVGCASSLLGEVSLALIFWGHKWWSIHCGELFKAQMLGSDRSEEEVGFSGKLGSATLQLCKSFETWFPHLQSGKNNSTSFLRLLYRWWDDVGKIQRSDKGGVPCRWPWETVTPPWTLVISTQEVEGDDYSRSVILCL